MTKDKRLIISMRPSKHKELKIFAANHKKTMNFIVQQALREFILKHSENKVTDEKDIKNGG